MNSMIKLILLFTILPFLFAYLQLPIKRVPSGYKTISSQTSVCSPESDQICYLKDISYCVQLFNNEKLYLMSIDFTIPISWIKHPECKVDNSTKCTLLETSFKSKLKTSIISIEKKFRAKKEVEQPQSIEGEMTTTGAMFPLTGVFEKGENIHFQTKDSNKLFSIYKLFLIGLFLSDQKDHIMLKNTNFINATSINSHTNKLSDGAISVRFDPSSEASFLYQIFDFVGEKQKTMTVYLGDNNVITLGDLSSKNAEDGYSSITWLPLNDKQFLMIDTLVIETEDSEKVQSVESSHHAVLTLSASYISLPKDLVLKFIQEFSKFSSCKVGENKYLECSDVKKEFNKKRVIFEILEAKIMFKIDELIKENGKTVILNIRQSQTQYIILGEPFFKKYYSAFDYNKNRIGIANRRYSIEQKVFSVITLIRFLTFIFVLGLGLLACYRPTKRIVEVWNWYYETKQNARDDIGETRRLKYSTVEVGGQYDDLNSKISNALNQDEI